MDEAFREAVGDFVTDSFWRAFQANYVTRDDIRYIRSTGMNTLRLPFHYKMLTNEPFMGWASKTHGYALLDTVINWCRSEGLYVVLDMHDAPGGQTGMNIDDSYGYPWLYTHESYKQRFVDIWKEIAARYKNNKTVLAFDLLNEPIASSFFPSDTAVLNKELAALLKRTTLAVRTIDRNHPVVLSGSQWGQDYSIFDSVKYDDNLFMTCHIYHCDTTEGEKGIKKFLDARARLNVPFWMGETGHEPDAWIAGFVRLLDRVNIGWTFWPYKKTGNATSMLHINEPKDWNVVTKFFDSDRSTYEAARKGRPDQVVVRAAMNELLNNLLYANCPKNTGYTSALGYKP
jgi:hypothetical protein